MRDLIFFTDRYPFSNSEAFIENEIELMASHFDRVFILPCGLMVDAQSCRNVPKNVIILMPPVLDDIWATKPSRIKKIFWGINHLLPWFLRCLFSKHFYKEFAYMCSCVGFTLRRALRIFRVLGPAIRNRNYYKNMLKNEGVKECMVYSYWLEPSLLFAENILENAKIKKIICRTHRWDLYANESGINYLPFQKQLIELTDHLYVISDDGLSYLKDVYPHLAFKMSISRLGTKDFGLNPQKADKKEFVIASCSFVHKVKRVHLIIEALSKLNKSDVKVRWIHFGGGQDLDAMKKYAEERLTGKVDFRFAGQVTNTFILDFYKKHHIDLFVNVSASEGIPVSIMEAISFSIPVIATDVGGTREIVINGENGLLLTKNFEIEELTQMIEYLRVNKDVLDAFRKKSRVIWEKTYSSDTNYRKFYNELLES